MIEAKTQVLDGRRTATAGAKAALIKKLPFERFDFSNQRC
jgi:hypothetical protein